MFPRLLDLFCGAGGAGWGYYKAGFRVTGVDHSPQPHYPCSFVQADALKYLKKHGCEFDVIHASPPCQLFSHYRRSRPEIDDTKYVNLIPEVRRLLQKTGKPYVIENVSRAPLHHPLLLCGSMFGLGVRRHRLFESSVMLFSPGGCTHGTYKDRKYPGGRSKEKGPTNKAPVRFTVEVGTWDIPEETQAQAMGIDWMSVREMSQAIPPAYTLCLGRQLWKVVESAADQSQLRGQPPRRGRHRSGQEVP